MPKLKPAEIENVIQRAGKGVCVAVLAEDFKCSEPTIRKIIKSAKAKGTFPKPTPPPAQTDTHTPRAVDQVMSSATRASARQKFKESTLEYAEAIVRDELGESLAEVFGRKTE